MPTISTEHPDVVTTDRINKCLEAIEREARPLRDSRQFYWRILYYCNSRVVPSESSYCHSEHEDPLESACVSNAIGQIERILDDPGQPFDEQILFHKQLHAAIARPLHTTEAALSGRAG